MVTRQLQSGVDDAAQQASRNVIKPKVYPKKVSAALGVTGEAEAPAGKKK
jgi:hypothetical protein